MSCCNHNVFAKKWKTQKNTEVFFGGGGGGYFFADFRFPRGSLELSPAISKG